MPDKKTVLIIEDDTFLLFIMKNQIVKEGYNVFGVLNGQEALDWLKNDTPDVIILDLILPKLSGFEVLDVIASDERLSRIPILVVSNLSQESDIKRAKDLGVREYLVKSKVDPGEIVRRVKDFLATQLKNNGKR